MDRQLFNARHFGFLQNSDCSKALKLFYSDIQQARLENMYIVALKLVIHDAYDSIWQDDLIYKMASVGIAGNTTLWNINWISDRKIKAKG